MKKTLFKKGLSVILALAIVILQVPTQVFAQNTLTFDEVHNDKEIISKVYKFNGEEKCITAVVNKDEGYSYLTGDIVMFSGSSNSNSIYGEYICKNIDGMLKLELVIEDITVFSEGNVETSEFGLFITSSNKTLYRFNNLEYGNLEYIDDNIKKAEGKFYINSSDCIVSSVTGENIVDNVADYSIIDNYILKVEYLDDTIDYIKIYDDTLMQSLNYNYTSNYESILTTYQVADNHCGFFYNNSIYTSYIAYANTGAAIYSSLEESITNSIVNLINGTDYDYCRLFGDKVELRLIKQPNQSTYSRLEVISLDNTKVEYKEDEIVTDYGSVAIKGLTKEHLHDNSEDVIIHGDNTNIHSDDMYTVLKQYINGGFKQHLYNLMGKFDIYTPDYNSDSPKFTYTLKDTQQLEFMLTVKSYSGDLYNTIISLDFSNNTLNYVDNNGVSGTRNLNYYDSTEYETGKNYTNYSSYNLNNLIDDLYSVYMSVEIGFKIYEGTNDLVVEIKDYDAFQVNAIGTLKKAHKEELRPIIYQEDNKGLFIIEEIKSTDFIISGLFETETVNKQAELNLNSIKDIKYSENDYLIDSSLNLYNVDTITYEGTSFIETVLTKVESDVLKTGINGYYIKSDGALYKDGVIEQSNIDNIFGNIIKKESKLYNIKDNSEFKKFRATDFNVSMKHLSPYGDYSTATITISKDTEIEKIIAPDGTEITDDTYMYEVYEDGIYLFRIYNTYGEEFIEHYEIQGLGGNNILYVPEIAVADNHIFITNIENNITIKYSKDRQNWLQYDADKGIKYANTEMYIQAFENSIGGSILSVKIDSNSKAVIENLTVTNVTKDMFKGYGYLYNGVPYIFDFDANGNITSTTLTRLSDGYNEMAIWGDYRFDYNYYDYTVDYIASKYHSNGVEGYGSGSEKGITIQRIFCSDKLIEDNEIENPVAMFFDSIYTYIVGAKGDVVKAQDKDALINGSGMTSCYAWSEEWLGKAVSYDEYTGKIVLEDGTVINTCYNEKLGVPLSDLKFYTQEDVDNNYDGTPESLTDLTPVNVSIAAQRVVYDGYIAMDTDEVIWIYNNEINAMVSCGTMALDKYSVDVTVDYTNWTNEGVKIYFEKSDTSNAIIKEDISSLDTLWMGYDSSYLDRTNLHVEDDNSVFQIMVDIDDGTLYEYFSLHVGYLDEQDNIVNITPTKMTNTVTGVEYTNIDNSTTFESHSNYYSDKYIVEYTLSSNDYYLYVEDSENVYTNGITLNNESIDIDAFIQAPYELYDEDSNLIPIKYERDGLYSAVLNINGTYYIDIYNLYIDGDYPDFYINMQDSYCAEYLDTTSFKLINIDTVNPSIKYEYSTTGDFKFSGEDNIGIGEDSNSAVSGIDKLFWSEDGIDFEELTNGSTIQYIGNQNTTLLNNDTVTTNSETIHLYTIDKAGNPSTVETFNIGLEVYKKINYENGKTTLDFWGDTDTDWSDTDYSYSYTINNIENTGHKVAVTEDTEVIIKVIKDSEPDIIKKETLLLKVCNNGKPVISAVPNENKASIELGDIQNGSFKELWVKVDNGEFIKYTTPEVTTELLSLGNHTVQAYQVATIENTDIIGDISSQQLKFTGDNKINVDIQYYNGKTVVKFWSNDDINNSEFNYSYEINGNISNGYELELTEDCQVTLKSSKDNYKSAENIINIKVVYTETPKISEIINNDDVKVSIGSIENAQLKTLSIKVDDSSYFDYTVAEKIIQDLTVGKHIVKANQTVETVIDGQTVTITSDEIVKEVTVEKIDEPTPTPPDDEDETTPPDDEDETTPPDDEDETTPEDKPLPGPETGDNTNIEFWIILAIISLTTIIVCIASKNKQIVR